MKTLILSLILISTVQASAASFCQFAGVKCPEGTASDMSCYKQICNGVVSPDIKMFTKQEEEQFRAWLQSQNLAETAEDICRRLTAVNPQNPEEKSDASRSQKFQNCLHRYGPTKK